MYVYMPIYLVVCAKIIFWCFIVDDSVIRLTDWPVSFKARKRLRSNLNLNEMAVKNGIYVWTNRDCTTGFKMELLQFLMGLGD